MPSWNVLPGYWTQPVGRWAFTDEASREIQIAVNHNLGQFSIGTRRRAR